MKHKGLIIATIAFFLIVNTTYFWEGKLGLFAMPAFLILVLVYFILGIALLRQLFFAFKEKFADKFRLTTLGILAAVLGLTFFFPSGIINFDRTDDDKRFFVDDLFVTRHICQCTVSGSAFVYRFIQFIFYNPQNVSSRVTEIFEPN